MRKYLKYILMGILAVALSSIFFKKKTEVEASQPRDYAEIAEIIKEVMAVPSCLLEHVTHRLRTKLLERFPMVTGGEIKVAKLTPPITAQMESATVTLSW